MSEEPGQKSEEPGRKPTYTDKDTDEPAPGGPSRPGREREDAPTSDERTPDVDDGAQTQEPPD